MVSKEDLKTLIYHTFSKKNTEMSWWERSTKRFDSKLYWTLSSFSLCGYWMYLNFCFCFFTWYSYRFMKSAVELKICAITAGIKKYKSIVKKRKNKHDEIVLLPKTKLNESLEA